MNLRVVPEKQSTAIITPDDEQIRVKPIIKRWKLSGSQLVLHCCFIKKPYAALPRLWSGISRGPGGPLWRGVVCVNRCGARGHTSLVRRRPRASSSSEGPPGGGGQYGFLNEKQTNRCLRRFNNKRRAKKPGSGRGESGAAKKKKRGENATNNE